MFFTVAMEIHAAAEICWEIEAFPETWFRMMPELEAMANQCVKNDHEGFRFVWPYRPDGTYRNPDEVLQYQVDLRSMQQTNLTTGTTRGIRRIAIMLVAL